MHSFSKEKEINPAVEPEITDKATRLTKFYAGQAIKALKLYGKAEEELDEYQKRLIETLYKLRNEVENGRLPISKIKNVYNDGLLEAVQIPTRGKRLYDMIKNMGLKPDRKGGTNFLVWEEDKLQRIFRKINA